MIWKVDKNSKQKYNWFSWNQILFKCYVTVLLALECVAGASKGNVRPLHSESNYLPCLTFNALGYWIWSILLYSMVFLQFLKLVCNHGTKYWNPWSNYKAMRSVGNNITLFCFVPICFRIPLHLIQARSFFFNCLVSW